MGLANHERQDVDVEDTTIASLDTFLTLSDRCCPVKTVTQHFKQRGNSWLTVGLEEACKKSCIMFGVFDSSVAQQR